MKPRMRSCLSVSPRVIIRSSMHAYFMAYSRLLYTYVPLSVNRWHANSDRFLSDRQKIPQFWPYEIIVVSDGSTDGTVCQVEQIAARRPDVRLLTYTPNRGKGYAVRYGILRARGQRILFSDADLATPIEEIEKLIARLDTG